MTKRENLKTSGQYSIAILHAHSTASDGMVSPSKLVTIAAQKGVRILALTDHDTLAGISEAKKAGKKFGVEIIIGEEIQTAFPRLLHIIGLFLKAKIPHNKSLIETINLIHAQGGLAIIPHPFVKLFNIIPSPTASIQKKDLIKIIERTKIDGIEIKHPSYNQNVQTEIKKFYCEHSKKLGAEIGASDSHFGQKDLLTNYTIFPGKTSRELYLAIKSKTTIALDGLKFPIPKKDILAQNIKGLAVVGAKRYLPFFDL